METPEIEAENHHLNLSWYYQANEEDSQAISTRDLTSNQSKVISDYPRYGLLIKQKGEVNFYNNRT